MIAGRLRSRHIHLVAAIYGWGSHFDQLNLFEPGVVKVTQ